jgi:hypothetical protein
MKKFLIALSVLAALIFSVVPSQAIIGVPDDVPGCDAAMFFICDTSLATGLNTQHILMDVGYPVVGTNAKAAGWKARVTGANVNQFHYTIYTVQSATVYNSDLPASAYDIASADAFTLVGNVAPAELTNLEVTIDGTTYYAGYVYYDNLGDDATPTVFQNSTVAQVLFVDLPNGMAAGTNWPVMENAINGNLGAMIPAAFQTVAAGMVNSDVTSEMVNMELFSPNGLNNAMILQAGGAASVNADNFWLYPRFYILDAAANTWFLFWKTDNTYPGLVHLDLYDDEENTDSSNITIDNEFTIVDVEPLLPIGTWPAATYPKQGWFDISWDCSGATAAAALTRQQSILGFTYQKAVGSAAQSWSVMTPMWRDVD